jgi:hypothetical protein
LNQSTYSYTQFVRNPPKGPTLPETLTVRFARRFRRAESAEKDFFAQDPQNSLKKRIEERVFMAAV